MRKLAFTTLLVLCGCARSHVPLPESDKALFAPAPAYTSHELRLTEVLRKGNGRDWAKLSPEDKLHICWMGAYQLQVSGNKELILLERINAYYAVEQNRGELIRRVISYVNSQ